jgi:mannose-6-phosphate isomerase
VSGQSEERPWGSWHVIDQSEGYKVKRIHVEPGGRLSYQTHAHRSEHWETVVAEPGHSVDVPRGAAHRICNDGSEELVIIEVQRGGYTGEDDICRLQDDYGREDAAASGPAGPSDVAQ